MATSVFCFVGLYETDFCKAQARNLYLNNDPDFVVFPTTAGHVQAALAFAKDHRLRILVAGAGHEWNGRNQQPEGSEGGSILIRMSLFLSKSADVSDTQVS